MSTPLAYYHNPRWRLCIVVSPVPSRLRWITCYIVSDVDPAFALSQVQPQASPYVQGWRVPLRYLASRFPASGHATVPQGVSILK